ncbi:MAG: transcription antitermination factor NusB [Pseudomonadota bacterium]
MSPSKRRKARKCVVQALYQWQLSGNAITDVQTQFIEDNNLNKVDIDYFNELLSGVAHNKSTIDEQLTGVIDRDITEMDPVELNVLRMAVYELQFRVDVPYKVVINEALEQNKVFGSEEGHKFVNGVLDKLACTLRQHEKKSH